MKKKQIISLVIIALMVVSVFAVLTPKVAATGEWQFGNISVGSNYSRCYSYNYESAHDGHPTNAEYDTAYISAEIPAYTLGSDYYIQARLFKEVVIDGNVVHNGMMIDGVIFGLTAGPVWVNTANDYYYDCDGVTFYFQYDLSWNSIFYGYDIWPNYWSGDDFANMFGNFNNHDIKVYFAVEWWYWAGLQWEKFGATCDMPDSPSSILGNCYTEHNEGNYYTWTWFIGSSDTHFSCSTPWTNTYLNAYVINYDSQQGRTPDGSFTYLEAYQSGATARVCTWVGGTTSGTVYIYGDSMMSPFSRFLVYVSSDDYNWRLSSEQLVYNNGNRWIDCGTPSGTYQYVLLIAYDSGTYSEMRIDCVNIGSHF